MVDDHDDDLLLSEARDVPVERIPSMLGELERVKAHLWVRLNANRTASGGEQQADESLGVKEAARRLGMSPGWLYRHARDLPFAKRVGPRTLRFSAEGIRRYLTARRVA